MNTILQDDKILRAVSSISQRAERITNDEKITQTYVEVGMLRQITNKNNQIIYGRRGTGKTHLLRYLENDLKDQKKPIAVYIDCRTLGSASDYNNSEIPFEKRCITLFRDIINEFYDQALNSIVYNPPLESEKAINALDCISNAINFPEQKVVLKELSEKKLKKSSNEKSASISASTSRGIEAGIGQNTSTGVDTEQTSTYQVFDSKRISFPQFNLWMKKLIEYTHTDVFFLIDEWSSLPIDLQPYLAEFFKKSLLPIPEISIKIAALEYRSKFSLPLERGNYIGFELGSDISPSLDLDDYYVYDRNPEAITKSFSEILSKHISNELPKKYLLLKFKIKNPDDFIRAFFTDSSNFQELVRASEGVIRDMINIFTISFFDCQRQDKKKIDKKSVIEASRQWFERDKSKNLDLNSSKILRKIVDEVIGIKKARSFLIPRELEKHENIQKLFDSRVIHFIKRGYADKDNPGVRYNVYSLDYGTYVDLLNTTKKPELDLIFVNERRENDDFIVPFDDKRSIRRIVLTEDILQ